jgi:mannonate dehydratase
MKPITIARVETFLTQPGTQRLIVVKVTTSEPGLYGLGCATFTQRHLAVKAAIEHHVAPFAIGKSVHDIEDFWHTAMVNGYWRNGPVLNNAISGIDMALWDIKGRLAGMPCYQLWGGRCRSACGVYIHVNGRDIPEVLESLQRRAAEGFQYMRCQLGGYDGLSADTRRQAENPLGGVYFDPRQKMRLVPKMFEAIRTKLDPKLEVLHDVHERLAPIDAVWLAKELEQYRLFFLEDLLAPEDIDWFEHIRAMCATPLAMGELFNNPREFVPLVSRRLIDFIRVHVSQVGGVSPALRLAHMCGPMGIRTAWHGPGDLTMIGQAANMHLGMAMPNFGIQEWSPPCQAELDMFPGSPVVRNGYAYVNDEPGLGIGFDEKLAARFPCDDANPQWTVTRLPDGTSWRP